MTLYGLIASLVWAGVAVFALCLFANLWKQSRPQAPTAAETYEQKPLPPDLEAFVNAFNTDWARDDAKKAIRERYEQHRDWNLVRRSVGLGVID